MAVKTKNIEIIENSIIGELLNIYESNKEDLKRIKHEIRKYGQTNDGLTDATESFEQGYNNALELVFDKLGIKY